MTFREPITTITISRQMGSLGAAVGKEVARRLGFRLVWRDLINEAAKRAGAPEMALAVIDDLGLLSGCSSPPTSKAYRQALGELMIDMVAAGGVIIIGRAGQVVLHDHPNVLHVRIRAPLQVRVDRIARHQAIAQEFARAQVEASDHSRRRFLRRHYHARWDDPDLYDLTINTARVSVQAAAELICSVVRQRLEPDAQAFASKQELY